MDPGNVGISVSASWLGATRGKCFLVASEDGRWVIRLEINQTDTFNRAELQRN